MCTNICLSANNYSKSSVGTQYNDILYFIRVSILHGEANRCVLFYTVCVVAENEQKPFNGKLPTAF